MSPFTAEDFQRSPRRQPYKSPYIVSVVAAEQPTRPSLAVLLLALRFWGRTSDGFVFFLLLFFSSFLTIRALSCSSLVLRVGGVQGKQAPGFVDFRSLFLNRFYAEECFD